MVSVILEAVEAELQDIPMVLPDAAPQEHLVKVMLAAALSDSIIQVAEAVLEQQAVMAAHLTAALAY
jgi:hypothetical protein